MRHAVLTWLAALPCAGAASFALAASDCEPFVKWYAELYPGNPSFISVTVDTRGIAGNQYIDNVSFNAAFYDEGNQRIAEERFNFPDEQLKGLSRGLYIAYLSHSYVAAKSAQGREMEFLCKTQGKAFVQPPDRVPANAELRGKAPDAATKVIGNVPEKKDAVSAKAASDFAGFWRNKDPNLGFVQFVRVVAIAPTKLRIEAWLRCVPPAKVERLQDCQHWGPDTATMTATGEVRWDHAAEPKVGRNILTLEGDTLKLHTVGPEWINYFRR